MTKTVFALIISLGSVLFGCGGVVSTETSSGDGGSDDTTETTTDSSGGSGGSNTGGSGGATTTTNTDGGSGGQGGSTNSGTEFHVSFSALADPSGGTIYQDAKYVIVLWIDYKAIGGDVTLGGNWRIKHFGTGPNTDIIKVFMGAESNECPYDPMTGIAECQNSDFVFPEGTTGWMQFVVHMDSNSTGATHGFMIENASDVGTTDAKITGDFPIKGPLFTMANQSYFLLTAATEGDVPATLGACTQMPDDATGFLYSLTTEEHDLWIQEQHFRVESVDGGAVLGSLGTPYFTNVHLVDLGSQTTLMGPMEIDPMYTDPGATSASFPSSLDFFLMKAESVEHLALTFNTACQEDVLGEFFGHKYRVVLQPATGTSVLDATDASPLDPFRVNPSGVDLLGETFQIQAP